MALVLLGLRTCSSGPHLATPPNPAHFHVWLVSFTLSIVKIGHGAQPGLDPKDPRIPLLEDLAARLESLQQKKQPGQAAM